MRAPVRYQSVMKTELFKDISEKEFPHSSHVNSFGTRNDDYPLHKGVVDHDHDDVLPVQLEQVGDQVNGELFEG